MFINCTVPCLKIKTRLCLCKINKTYIRVWEPWKKVSRYNCTIPIVLRRLNVEWNLPYKVRQGLIVFIVVPSTMDMKVPKIKNQERVYRPPVILWSSYPEKLNYGRNINCSYHRVFYNFTSHKGVWFRPTFCPLKSLVILLYHFRVTTKTVFRRLWTTVRDKWLYTWRFFFFFQWKIW